MLKKILLPSFFLIFLFFIQGCVLITKRRQLDTLRKLGESQRLMELHIEESLTNLAQLKNDIEKEKLSRGISYQEIINRYGRPVLEWELENESGFSLKLLYRHPTRHYDIDRIYLYFDSDLKLLTWRRETAS